ncbi:RNA polymerase subunit sigma-70 [Clostridium sp. Bc-iso-3]|nr:RNA polymerase subunit sigma-70 [Clostridium sp. Bc-iso-3]
MLKKATKTEIKNDLLDQLERNGTMGKHYLDLVFDYMDFYDTKKKLISDIKKRGVAVEYNNGGGQKGIKKNDSIDQLIKVNGQMLTLLKSLGLKPSQDGDAYDDMEM